MFPSPLKSAGNETAVLRFTIINRYQIVAPFTQTASHSHLADSPTLKGIMTGGREIRRVIVQTELRVCREGGDRPLVSCLKLWLHEARGILDHGMPVHT